jgi:hypothetical protein
MSEKKPTMAENVRSLPGVVWFCVVLVYLGIGIIAILPNMEEIEGFGAVLIFVIWLVPYVWFIIVRFTGDSDKNQSTG